MHHLRHTADYFIVRKPKKAYSDLDPQTVTLVPVKQRRLHLPLPVAA